MPEYRYEMMLGGSKPFRGITAKDDADAFVVMKEVVKREKGVYVKGSMTTSENGRNFRKVPDPLPAEWKLLYLEPVLQASCAVRREERLEIIRANDHAEAEVKADQFLARGGLVYAAAHHKREFISLTSDNYSPEDLPTEVRDAYFAHTGVPLTELQKRAQPGKS